MTHVSGPLNRGLPQPPYHRSSVSTASRQRQDAQSLHFSGVFTNTRQSMVNKSLPMFEKMNSVFIWAFLFQDVVALWFTRFYALLTEGRKKYNPKHDPEVKNKSLAQQVWRYGKENTKGLNWQNLWEGVKREFATGPGLLIMPALTFLGVSWAVNEAIKMPFRAVKGIGKGLIRHLDGKYETQEAYKAQVADYIKSIFQDPKLKAEKGGDLEKWSKKWVENLYQGNRTDQRKGAEKLGKELENIILEFNNKHRSTPYSPKTNTENPVERLIQDEHPIHQKLATWISYEPKTLMDRLKDPKLSAERQLEKGQKRLHHMPVQDLMADLKHMGGLVRDIEANAIKTSQPLDDAAQQSMQKMVKWKFGMALTATGITTAYLIKLAFWAQNNNTYQATRFLNEKTAQNQRSQTPSSHAYSMRANQLTPHMSSIAGSANGLQPVFSNKPNSTNFFHAPALQTSTFNAPSNHEFSPMKPYSQELRGERD